MEKQKVKKTWLKNIAFYFSTLSQSKINIYFYLIVSTIMSLFIPLANVLFPKIMIMGLSGKISALTFTLTPVAQALLVVFIFFAVTTAVQTVKEYIDKKISWYGPYLQFKLREKLQYRAMTMNFSETENKATLDKYASAEHAVVQSENIFVCVCGVAASCVLVVVYSIIICSVHPVLLLIATLNAWTGYALTAKARLYEASLRDLRADIDRKKNYLFQTMFDYAFGKETRLFDLSHMLSGRFAEQRDRKKALKTKSENKAFLFSLIELLTVFLREAAVYGLLIWFFLDGRITVDNFVMYIGLAASFSVITKGMTNQLSQLAEIDVYLTDFRELTQENEPAGTGLKLNPQTSYTLEFRNVFFAYPGQNNMALNGITFTLEGGRHTALVGLNGSGKTTVVKLICRLYEPNQGEILLNGVNIKHYDKQSYLQQIAPVFQDSKLYAFSIKENIALDETCDTARMWEILDDLGMAEKIRALQNGADTQALKILYDDGVEFSGGERQMLSIARAMYKDSGILALDEPTAALDALIEKRIYESFGKLTKGRTTLFISHRLNSNRFCDSIIFLENGKVLAKGDHDTLMDTCIAYREMYNMQARYYIDAKEETRFDKRT